MPQDVSAFKVTPPLGYDCIIVVNWNPPSNADASLVERYMVKSPSGNFTTTRTAVSVIYDCEVESNAQIGIHAVDSCGRGGASSQNILVKLLETSSNSSGSVTTEQNPITEEQR